MEVIMKKQVSGICIMQSAKFIAVLYLILSAIFCIPFGIYMVVAYGFQEGGFLLLAPFLYAFFSFIFFAFFSFVYNIIADMIGGLEFIVKDVE